MDQINNIRDIINSSMADLKSMTSIKGSEDMIRVHCDFVRHQIIVASESAIAHVNKYAAQLISKVDIHERAGIDQVACSENERAVIEKDAAYKVNQFLEYVQQVSTGSEPDSTRVDQLIEQAKDVKHNVQGRIKAARSLAFGNKEIVFHGVDIELLTCSELIGELAFRSISVPYSLDFSEMKSLNFNHVDAIWPIVSSDDERYFALIDGISTHCEFSCNYVCVVDRLGRTTASRALKSLISRSQATCTFADLLVVCDSSGEEGETTLSVFNGELKVVRQKRTANIYDFEWLRCNREYLFCVSCEDGCSEVHVFTLDGLELVTSLNFVFTDVSEVFVTNRNEVIVVSSLATDVSVAMLELNGERSLCVLKTVSFDQLYSESRVFFTNNLLVFWRSDELDWFDLEGSLCHKTTTENKPSDICEITISASCLIFHCAFGERFFILNSIK